MLCIGFLAMWCFTETPDQPAVNSLTFCDGYRRVLMSHADTRKTKEQVAENEAVFRKVCLPNSK